MAQHAFWRRLDVPGHDGAVLDRTPTGWLLRGMAVFRQDGLPACLAYEVELHEDWRTHRAKVEGFAGGEPFVQRVERTAQGWLQNGERVTGLDTAVDIDFGFTPATNMAQLRRVNLAIGEQASFDVAWLDVDAPKLALLPQAYRRIGELAYAYDSPTVDYQATLRMDRNGFAADYPTLWEML